MQNSQVKNYGSLICIPHLHLLDWANWVKAGLPGYQHQRLLVVRSLLFVLSLFQEFKYQIRDESIGLL